MSFPSWAFQSNMDMPKMDYHTSEWISGAANGQLTARAVAGKKIKVSTAMVFIEELSRRVSSAIYADQPNMALASVDRK
jgi:hypothetical protein